MPSPVPYLSVESLKKAETGIFDAIVSAFPEFQWIKMIPASHIDEPLLAWIAAKVNALSGATPG